MKKKRYRWIVVVLAVYCLAGCIIYFMQDKILLHPEVIAQDSSFSFNQPFTETKIEADNETVYDIVQFHTRDTAKKGIVLYFHGNRQNVIRYAPYAEWFTRNGYDVWMADYPGFGKSTGAFTEAALYEEALQVYKLARNICAPSQIVIFGKSLGSGIAAQLASVRDCKRLLLETPYYSIPSIFQPYLFAYPLKAMLHLQIPTYEYLQKVTAPVTLFHGTSDGVIPYRHSTRLKTVLKPGDELVTIEGGSHNDLGNYPLLHRKLDSVLNLKQ